MKRFFKYFEPLWTGRDDKISLRAVLAIVFSIDFVRNLSFAVFKWDTGRSFEGLSLVLGIEAGLIVSLLGISALQNVSERKIDSGNTSTTINNTTLEVKGDPAKE